MDIPPDNKWMDLLTLTLLSALAGTLGHLMRNVQDNRKTTLGRLILEAAASGFIGYLAVLVCRASSITYEWMGVITGVLGWLGAAASIQIFEQLVRKKLGLHNVDDSQNKNDVIEMEIKTITDDVADNPDK